MANILYANNAAGTLLAGITNVATALTLNAGQGALFPALVPPQVFYVTLTDAATQTLIEIVKVTAVAGDVFSITRAQDGTSALSWSAGDIVSQRTIALELRGFENAAEGLFGTTGQNVIITPSTTLGIKGTPLGDNANAGSVGEFISATLLNTPIASGVTANAVGVFLSAGDWDVSGVAQFTPAGGASITVAQSCIGTVSATIGGLGTVAITQYAASTPNNTQVLPTPTVRITIGGSIQVFVTANVTFSGGACTVSGFIRARRVR